MTPRRRRLGTLALIVGLAVAGAPLLSPSGREERRFVIRLREPEAVRRIEVRWQAPDGEVLRELSLAFRAGHAPDRVVRRIRLAPGRHRVSGRIRRGRSVERFDRRVDVAEGASEITLLL